MSSAIAGAGKHVVIVEDDPITSKFVSFLLEDEGYRVTALHRGCPVVETVTGQETSLVLLDVNLPDIDGFTLTKLLRAHRYFGPVILLTGRSGIGDKLEGFKHGADDYLTKPFEPLELLVRIASICRRTHAVDQHELSRVVRVGDAELSIATLTYRSSEIARVELAPTEMKLLEILMRNSQIVLSRKILIERVWGFDFLEDTNRVDVYIRRLRRKVEPDPRSPRYVHTERGLGYVFRVCVKANAEPVTAAMRV